MRILLLLAVCAGLSTAQIGIGGGRPGDPRRSSPIVDTSECIQPGSLTLLVQRAPLIVEGVVQTLLPPVVDPPTGIHLHTDSQFAVSRILKGALPDGKTLLTVSQLGGNPAMLPKFKAGDHYVLFLYLDNPLVSKMIFVYPDGGYVKIETGKIAFLVTSSAQLMKYNGTDSESFIKLLEGGVSGGTVQGERLCH